MSGNVSLCDPHCVWRGACCLPLFFLILAIVIPCDTAIRNENLADRFLVDTTHDDASSPSPSQLLDPSSPHLSHSREHVDESAAISEQPQRRQQLQQQAATSAAEATQSTQEGLSDPSVIRPESRSPSSKSAALLKEETGGQAIRFQSGVTTVPYSGVVVGKHYCRGDVTSMAHECIGPYNPDPPTEVMLPTSTVTLETWVRVRNHSACVSFIGCFYDDSYFSKHGLSLGIHRGFVHFGVNLTPDPTSMQFPPTASHWEMDGSKFDALPMSLWTLGRWYHVAGTWDGQYRRVYLDGKLVQSLHQPALQNATIIYPHCSLVVGSAWEIAPGMRVLFDGDIAETRMWNISLSPQQISTYKDLRVPPNTPGLIGLWRSLDSAGNATDFTGKQPIGRPATHAHNIDLPQFPPPNENAEPPTQITSAYCKRANLYSCAQNGIPANTREYSPDLTQAVDYSESEEMLLMLYEFVPEECAAVLHPWVCLNSHQRCEVVTGVSDPHMDGVSEGEGPAQQNYTLWGGLPPCKSLCLQVAEKCSASFQSMSMIPSFAVALQSLILPCPTCDCTPDYTRPDALINPLPSGSPYYFGHIRVQNMPCAMPDFSGSSSNSQSANGQSCRWPLQRRRRFSATSLPPNMSTALPFANGINETLTSSEMFARVSAMFGSRACTYPCIPPIMPSETREAFRLVSDVVSIMALACSTLLVGLLLLANGCSLAKFPANLILCMSVCVMGQSAAMVISPLGGHDDFLCDDISPNGAWHNSVCATQAIMLQFFGLSNVFYWLALSLSLRSTVLNMQNRGETINSYLLLILPPVLPLLSVIALLCTDRLGLSTYGSFCWIKDDTSNGVYLWLFFYSELAFAALVSLFVITTILRKLLSSYHVLGMQGGMRLVFANPAIVRMFVLILILLVVGTVSLIGQIHIQTLYPEFERQVQEFFACITLYALQLCFADPQMKQEIRNRIGSERFVPGATMSSVCPDFSPNFNPTLVFLGETTFASLGILLPLVFGSTHAVWGSKNVRRLLFCLRRVGSGSGQAAAGGGGGVLGGPEQGEFDVSVAAGVTVLNTHPICVGGCGGGASHPASRNNHNQNQDSAKPLVSSLTARSPDQSRECRSAGQSPHATSGAWTPVQPITCGVPSSATTNENGEGNAANTVTSSAPSSPAFHRRHAGARARTHAHSHMPTHSPPSVSSGHQSPRGQHANAKVYPVFNDVCAGGEGGVKEMSRGEVDRGREGSSSDSSSATSAGDIRSDSHPLSMDSSPPCSTIVTEVAITERDEEKIGSGEAGKKERKVDSLSQSSMTGRT